MVLTLKSTSKNVVLSELWTTWKGFSKKLVEEICGNYQKFEVMIPNILKPSLVQLQLQAFVSFCWMWEPNHPSWKLGPWHFSICQDIHMHQVGRQTPQDPQGPWRQWWQTCQSLPLWTLALDRQEAECAALLQTQALHDWDDTILKDFGYMGAARFSSSCTLCRYATASKVLQLGTQNSIGRCRNDDQRPDLGHTSVQFVVDNPPRVSRVEQTDPRTFQTFQPRMELGAKVIQVHLYILYTQRWGRRWVNTFSTTSEIFGCAWWHCSAGCPLMVVSMYKEPNRPFI